MENEPAPFFLTNDQFEKLVHYIDTRITVAFESHAPQRAEQVASQVRNLREALRRALTGGDEG